jgi:hypothetical protein
MRLIHMISVVTVLGLSNGIVNAVDWNKQHTPTRKEWLELSLFKKIIEVTDLWEKRIGVEVVVFPKEETIAIVLTASNGQEKLSPTVCVNYKDIIRMIVDGHIKQYDWAKGTKIEINCV